MKKIGRVLGFIILIPVALLILALVASLIVSPPGGGRDIAARIDVPYPAVVAHRGASYLAPEATGPAYYLARDIGADYLEADLQRTADGVIIVFHDDTPVRTTDAALVFPGRENDLIETFTYDELLQLDAGSWFNEAFPDLARSSYAGLNILTLDELIDIIEAGGNNPGLYLETKSADRHAGYEETIVEILQNRGWVDNAPGLAAPDTAANEAVGAVSVNTAAGPARVVFQSFYPESIVRLQQLAPDVPRVLLVSQEIAAAEGWDTLMEQASTTANGIGPVGYASWPWIVGSAHRAGLIVHPYTINAAWQMKLLSFFGADGFFTDRSDLALETLNKGGPVDLEAIFARFGY